MVPLKWLAAACAAGCLMIAAIYARQIVTDADGRGYERGRAELELKFRQELDEANARAAKAAAARNAAETARLEAEAETERLTLELEDAARESPDADRPALSADSVRRLNSR